MLAHDCQAQHAEDHKPHKSLPLESLAASREWAGFQIADDVRRWVVNDSKARFVVECVGSVGHCFWVVFDRETGHPQAERLSPYDAVRIATALNEDC